MAFSEKVKTMDNKIEQTKAQYDLGRQRNEKEIMEVLVKMNI